MTEIQGKSILVRVNKAGAVSGVDCIPLGGHELTGKKEQ